MSSPVRSASLPSRQRRVVAPGRGGFAILIWAMRGVVVDRLALDVLLIGDRHRPVVLCSLAWCFVSIPPVNIAASVISRGWPNMAWCRA